MDENMNQVELLAEIKTLRQRVKQLETDRNVRDQLDQLAHINPTLLSDMRLMPLNKRLSLIAEHAAKILASETCTVLLVTEPGWLRCEASFGYDVEQYPPGKLFQINPGHHTGLTGFIASNGQPFIGNEDLLASHPAVKSNPETSPLGKTYSILMIPLIDPAPEKTIVGWLRWDNKKDLFGQTNGSISFTTEDQVLASLFAGTAVVAIQVARIVEELDTLITSAPYGIMSLNDRSQVIQTNPFTEHIFGYTHREMIGLNARDLYSDVDEPNKVGKMLQDSSTNRISERDTQIKSRSGEIIPIRISYVGIRNETSKHAHTTVGYFRDMREVNKIQLALDQERILLRTLIDHIPDYIYIKDIDGRYLEVNSPGALRMGSAPNQLIGLTDFDVFPVRLAKAYRKHESEVIRTKHPKINYEEPTIDLATGEKGTLLTTKVPWIDTATNEVRGVIGIGRIITDLRKMYDATNELITIDSPSDLVQSALRHAKEAGKADLVTVILFDNASNANLAMTFPPSDVFSASEVRQDSLTRRIYTTGRRISVQDVRKLKNSAVNPVTINLGFQSVLGLPMSIRGRRIGVMWLHYAKPRKFTEELIQSIEFFVHQFTIAYDRVLRIRYQEQVQNAVTVGIKLTALGEQSATLGEIVEQTKKLLACDAVTLYLFNPDTNDLNYKPIMAGVWNEVPLSVFEGTLKDTFVHKMLTLDEMLIVEDTNAHPDFRHRRFVKDEGIKSCVVIPLQFGLTKVGIMFVNYRHQHSFIEDQEQVTVKLFADLAAVAITNIRYTKMRQSIFMNLAHEMHLPITSVIADSEVIRDELKKTNLAQLQMLAEHNLGQVERVALVTDTIIKTLSRDTQMEVSFTRHNLLRPVLEACILFEHEALANGCEIKKPQALGAGFPDMMMSLSDLTRAFKNIISNAVKYSYRSKQHFARIIGSWKTIDRFVVSVQNYGVGIESEEIRDGLIFSLYYRGKNARDRYRTGGGIGLADAKHVIEDMHNGSIRVTSVPIEGHAFLTTFYIELPVLPKKIE